MLALEMPRKSPREMRFPVTHKKIVGSTTIVIASKPNNNAFKVLKYSVMPDPSVLRSFMDVFQIGAIASP
jgi:hypothetical protein